MVIMVFCLAGLTERDLYDAKEVGDRASVFFTTNIEKGVDTVFIFSSERDNEYKYKGFIFVIDYESVMRVDISYYVSSSTIYILPESIQIRDLEGNILLDQKGGNLMVHSLIIQKTKESLFLFLDDECYIFLDDGGRLSNVK